MPTSLSRTNAAEECPGTGNRNYAIGVFDSGLGGLTVVKELIRQLPREDIVYFGDTARVPYGTKSKESVVRFSVENVTFLLQQNVKMVVVACNTASSLAIPTLKKHFTVPIVSVITPGAQKAARVSCSKRIGIIATPATVNSQSYAETLKKIDRSIRVRAQACPLFVPLAEEGWLDGKIPEAIAGIYLKSMKRAKVDTLVLGCTHYPLLKSVIQKTMGPKVTLIDSAQEVALEVQRLLAENEMESSHKRAGQHMFWVSDEPKHFCTLARRFLARLPARQGFDIKNVKRCRVV